MLAILWIRLHLNCSEITPVALLISNSEMSQLLFGELITKCMPAVRRELAGWMDHWFLWESMLKGQNSEGRGLTELPAEK